MRKLSTELIKSGSFLGSFTGSFSGSIDYSITASYALTSSVTSYADYAVSSSYTTFALSSLSSSNSITASYAANAQARIITGSGVLTTDSFDDVSVQNSYNNIVTAFKSQEGEGLSRYDLINGFIDDFNNDLGIFKSSSFFFYPSGSYGSKGYFTNELPLGDLYFIYTDLLLHFSGSNNTTSSFDSSARSSSLFYFGDAVVTSSQYKFNSSSLSVNGNGFITSSALNLGSDYTVEFWARSTVSSFVPSKNIFSLGNAGIFSQDSSNSVLWSLLPSSVNVPSINNWNHYAFTRTNNIIRFYLNGQLQLSGSNSSSVSNEILNLGRASTGGGTTYWSGFIDEFRVTGDVSRYQSNSFTTQSIEFYDNIGSDPTGSAFSSSLFTDYKLCNTNVENVSVVILAEPVTSSFNLNNNFNLYITKDSGSTYYGSVLSSGSFYSSSIQIYTSTLNLSYLTASNFIGIAISSSVSPVRIYGVGVVSNKSLRRTTLATTGLVGINFTTASSNGVSSSYNIGDTTYDISNTMVFLSGSSMIPYKDFTLTDGQLALTSVPDTNQKISLFKFTSLVAESNPNTSVIDLQNIDVAISQSVFTLSQQVTIPKNIIVTNNGLVKNLSVDYTISGSRFLVFNSLQTPGDKITVRYINSVGNANIEVYKYTGNGISSSFSVSSSLNNPNGLLVSINGILQTPTTHYYIDSSSYYDSVVLDAAPRAGSLIEIRKIQYASPYSTLTSSFSTTASYALNADVSLTASNLVQNVLLNFSQSQEYTLTNLPLDGNNWNINIIDEWNSGSVVLDQFYDSCSLLLHFSGSNQSRTFLDNSKNNYTVSISGSPVISTQRYKFTNSSLFLTNNSFLYYSPILPTASAFTVETWVYPINYSNQPVVWSQGTGYPLGSNRTQLYINSNGNVIVQNGVNIITSSNVLPVSEWTNIAFVKSSSFQYLYIDGTLAASGSISDVESAPFLIGNNYLLTSQFFNGNIDEFRVTNYPRYTSNFTPSNARFNDTSSAVQPFVRLYATVGGLNDNYVDYGVQKLSDTSLKVVRLTKTTPLLSGSLYLSDSPNTTYINVVDNSKALIQVLRSAYATSALTSSFAITSSFASTSSYSSLAKTSESSSYISASIINVTGLMRITGSLQISGSSSGVYLFTQSIASSTWNITHSLGSRYPVIQVYSASYQSVSPNDYTITSVDENKTRLVFTGLVTGSATIMATPVSVISTTLRSTTIFTPNNIVFGI